jgi:CelD/BcsL family acetyltransferase involved in cellulose biosynthesis
VESLEEPRVSPASLPVGLPSEPRPAIAATPGARLTAEVRRDLALGAGDAAAFAAMLRARPPLAVFLSSAWLSGYFAEPPAGGEPLVLLLREGGVLRGFVPIEVHAGGRPARVRLLGGGKGSDRTDLVAARGFEAACADAFVAWLGESFGRGFVLALHDVPGESPLWGAIHRANEERSQRLALQPREVHALPWLDLAEVGAEPGRVPAQRAWHPSSLQKHRRWLSRRGRIRVERLEDRTEVLSALESLAALLHARWQGRPGGSALDDARTMRFHRHVAPRLLEQGLLRMIRLRADERTIAVFYGVAAAGAWAYCLAGYDRAWAGRIHLGQITLACAIDEAVREGAGEFDFLKGAHAVKYLWAVRERVTLDAEVYAAGRRAQLARAARAARETAAAGARFARG